MQDAQRIKSIREYLIIHLCSHQNYRQHVQQNVRHFLPSSGHAQNDNYSAIQPETNSYMQSE